MPALFDIAGKETTMDAIRVCVGIDGNGIERVFGEGPNFDVAETECRKAIKEYVTRRPDTGPISKWKMELAVSK